MSAVANGYGTGMGTAVVRHTVETKEGTPTALGRRAESKKGGGVDAEVQRHEQKEVEAPKDGGEQVHGGTKQVTICNEDKSTYCMNELGGEYKRVVHYRQLRTCEDVVVKSECGVRRKSPLQTRAQPAQRRAPERLGCVRGRTRELRILALLALPAALLAEGQKARRAHYLSPQGCPDTCCGEGDARVVEASHWQELRPEGWNEGVEREDEGMSEKKLTGAFMAFVVVESSETPVQNHLMRLTDILGRCWTGVVRRLPSVSLVRLSCNGTVRPPYGHGAQP
ncbi:hypothetical protein BC826DRAFT_1176353 [Russula brevipes]|nr:hypothetical protein BC826DRAFT_1176353 [Russula brevipes]